MTYMYLSRYSHDTHVVRNCNNKMKQHHNCLCHFCRKTGPRCWQLTNKQYKGMEYHVLICQQTYQVTSVVYWSSPTSIKNISLINYSQFVSMQHNILLIYIQLTYSLNIQNTVC